MAPHPDLGLLAKSPLLPRLLRDIPTLRLKLPPPAQYVRHTIDGVPWQIARPVTLTPFASAQACSARCRFCSETLVPRDGRRLSATLRPGPRWFEGFARALRELRGLPVGLSLSGLESTDDPAWLGRVLDICQQHIEQGGRFEERVLYSNGAGLCAEAGGAALVDRLQRFGLSRIELSRHDFRAERCAQIMRFRAGRAIGEAEVFERCARDLSTRIPLRLVCVLQRGGVETLEDARAYLAWAQAMGIRDLVFRELSRLGDLYRPNVTARYVEAHRVPIEDLIEPLCSDAGRGAFAPVALTAGYYYWNLETRYADGLRVTFETSDYTEMKSRHRSGVVHKLVFHGNGRLCADWDPEREILLCTN